MNERLVKENILLKKQIKGLLNKISSTEIPAVKVEKTDGFLVTATKDNVFVGCVLRCVHKDGNVPSYSDCTVVEIVGGFNSCSKFFNLKDAIEKGLNVSTVFIKLHRPMLGADGEGNSYLVTERFEIPATFLLERCNYKVVMNAGSNNSPAKPANYYYEQKHKEKNTNG